MAQLRRGLLAGRWKDLRIDQGKVRTSRQAERVFIYRDELRLMFGTMQ